MQELKAENKTQIIIFNKIDLCRERHFDEHLPEEIRKELLQELKQSWMAKSNNEAVFISAETGENLDELRDIMYVHIKKLYLDRYPYKASYLTDY